MTQVWQVFYLAAIATAIAAADGGTVEGTVVNSVTGDKLAGVSVEMTTGREGSLKVRTVTGAAGEFRFLNVDPGEHSLSYEKDDFGQPESEPPEEAVRVTTQGTALVQKKLDPLTTLEGRVLDNENRGVRRIAVELLTGRGQARRSVSTDDAGGFRIAGLRPGVYLLRATPNRPSLELPIRSYADLMRPAETASLQKRILQAPYYYPGVPDMEAAAPVRINGEKWLSGCDIRFPKRDSFAIRGKLVDPAGAPVPEATVKLKSADTSYTQNGTPPDAQISTDRQGRFEFPKVTPGRWHLMVTSDYGKPRAFQSVVLTRADLEDVTLRLALPFAQDVSVEGLAPADSDEHGPRVQLVPVDGPLEQEAISGRPKNGQIRMEHLYPGRYRFYESRREGYYLDAILMGDRDVLGQDVELMAGAAPIRMVYKRDGGTVRGTVADGGAVTVVLVPEQSSPDHWHSALSDAEGHFEIGDLRPGNYFALAVGPAGALQDPQFLALVEHDGTLLHVNAGETAVADLRPAKWPR